MHLYARRYGKVSAAGTPLLILHGLFGSHRNWHPVARSLADERLVYSLDLRNHGQSPHAEVMAYPHMADDVLAFIQHILEHTEFNCVDIIAHSMGGKAAMWLALSHPDVVRKLVVVDIAPLSYDHDFSEVLNGFQSIPLQRIKSRQDADHYLSGVLSEHSLRQFLLQNLQFKDGRYQWRLNLQAIGESISDLIAFPETSQIQPFKKRVLFVGGGQSDYLSKDAQKQTRVLFPSASFSMLKTAGHWLHAEQPELFEALILPYLNSD